MTNHNWNLNWLLLELTLCIANIQPYANLAPGDGWRWIFNHWCKKHKKATSSSIFSNIDSNLFMSGHESVKNEGFCRSIQLLTLFYNLQKSFIFLLLLFVTS